LPLALEALASSMTTLMPTRTLYSKDGITLTKKGDVLTIDINRGDNVVNPELTAALAGAVEVAEKASHPKSLVITSTGKKFYSNGLDLNYMRTNPKKAEAMIEGFFRVLARILTIDCHTVAAINGHGFGAGIFLALACDWRVMRTQRGFLCFPEINLGLKLSKPFAELAKSKLSPYALREGVLLGKRWSSAEALALGIIDKEVPMESLQEEAHKLAAGFTPKNLRVRNFVPKSFHQMKVELYTDAYRALTDGMMTDEPKSRL